jgi:hypothetical protein
MVELGNGIEKKQIKHHSLCTAICSYFFAKDIQEKKNAFKAKLKGKKAAKSVSV